MVQGMVPLCSWQYERLFNTVRVPGIETDRIVHYQVSGRVARNYDIVTNVLSFPSGLEPRGGVPQGLLL